MILDKRFLYNNCITPRLCLVKSYRPATMSGGLNDLATGRDRRAWQRTGRSDVSYKRMGNCNGLNTSNSMVGLASRDKSDGDIRCHYTTFIVFVILTMKMKTKLMEHNIPNGPIRLQSRSIKDIAHFCTSFHHFRDISISHFWPWKSRSNSRGATFAVTPLDGDCQPL